MIQNVINSIVEAENKSIEMGKRANSKAKEILLKSQMEAESLKKSTISNAKIETARKEKKAEEQVEENIKNAVAKAEKEAVGIRATVFNNMLAAQKLIISALEDKNGNS